MKLSSQRLAIIILSFLLIGIYGCSGKIYTSRKQFIRNELPTVKLNKYKSVQDRPEQNGDIAVSVAISGGGSRAYNFAMGILLGLEDVEEENLLKEIDYFSTVSGGGFAAGSYLASLYEHNTYGSATDFSLQEYYDAKIKKDLSRSFVAPVVKSWFNIKNWFTFLDDGDALERSINYTVLGFRHRRETYGKKLTRSLQLGDFFIDKNDDNRRVKYPMMVANGTIYNSMALFPFSPDIIDTFQVSGYSHNFHKYSYDENIDPYTMPLSVGIKASGSFPVAISNTTLISSYDPDKRFLHIIDGGIADNIGSVTALELLRQDKVAKKKILLVVDADGGGIVPTFSNGEGGAFSLSVYGKLPASGLDSRHYFLRRELLTNCNADSLELIFMSFGSFIENNTASPPTIIHRKKAQKEMIELLENPTRELTPVEYQILYELLTDVKTKYTVKPLEQKLLTLAGRKVVEMNRKRLIQVFGL